MIRDNEGFLTSETNFTEDEDERLIRVWISPLGKDINLEILQQPIFKVRVNFIENHWYHVCQSWSSDQAAWNFYLNGKLKAGGFEPKVGQIWLFKRNFISDDEYNNNSLNMRFRTFFKLSF